MSTCIWKVRWYQRPALMILLETYVIVIHNQNSTWVRTLLITFRIKIVLFFIGGLDMYKYHNLLYVLSYTASSYVHAHHNIIKYNMHFLQNVFSGSKVDIFVMENPYYTHDNDSIRRKSMWSFSHVVPKVRDVRAFNARKYITDFTKVWWNLLRTFKLFLHFHIL